MRAEVADGSGDENTKDDGDATTNQQCQGDDHSRLRRHSSSASQKRTNNSMLPLEDSCPVHQHLGDKNHARKDCVVRKVYVAQQEASKKGSNIKKTPSPESATVTMAMEDFSERSLVVSRWGPDLVPLPSSGLNK